VEDHCSPSDMHRAIRLLMDSMPHFLGCFANEESPRTMLGQVTHAEGLVSLVWKCSCEFMSIGMPFVEDVIVVSQCISARHRLNIALGISEGKLKDIGA
jgi:hypothetical protein